MMEETSFEVPLIAHHTREISISGIHSTSHRTKTEQCGRTMLCVQIAAGVLAFTAPIGRVHRSISVTMQAGTMLER